MRSGNGHIICIRGYFGVGVWCWCGHVVHVKVEEGGREDRALWDSVGEVAGFGLFVLEGDVSLSACQVVGKPSFRVVGHVGFVDFVD